MTAQDGRPILFCDQKWFHLGIILSTPFTFPMIEVGHLLAQQYGPGTAVCSVLVGNLMLWLIGLSVVAMAREDKSNALENAKNYLGKHGAAFFWLILMISMLNWFIHQINSATATIGSFFPELNKTELVRFGAALGLLTTLISIGGIRLLKTLTLYSFPFVFFYHSFSIIRSDYPKIGAFELGLSGPAVISTMLVLLPGMINLPTLYRHGQSKEDCYLGLTLMILLISFYEISSICMHFNSSEIVFSTNSTFIFITICITILTLLLINFINIYYGSVWWEAYLRRFEGAKGYAIIGLMGTAGYTFVQVYTPIRLIEDFTNCYLASLGIVLICGYLVRIIVQHRPRPFEQLLNGGCWLFGCLVSTILVPQNVTEPSHALLMGVVSSALLFLFIIFIEETIWSFRKIFLNDES